MSPTRRMWIDTDTASDDAVAIVLALKHPNTEVCRS
jgi:inosine-uridine nucleoside N-ribohydrolase